MIKRISIVVFFALSLLVFTVGCSNEKQDSAAQNETPTFSFTYELGSNDWSSLALFQPSQKVIEAYQFAADYPEVLDYMPCYCGCYEDAGHINNTDCFVKEVKDNVAILDNMGLG